MNETQQRLVDAARSCIGERGLAATTSRDITGAAGANLAAITYHFGSKDALVAEALLASLREWLSPAVEVLRGGADPTTRTVLAVQTLLATFEAHRDEVGLYLEALVQAQRIESVGEGIVALWTELRESIGEQIVEMQTAGQLPVWVQADAMASLLVAVANGLIVQVTLDPDGPSLAAMAAQFSSLLLGARVSP